MGKYKCLITSDNTSPREYEVDTTSAARAAYALGRAESNEQVTVYRKRTLEILSRARWGVSERSYYLCGHPKYLEEEFVFNPDAIITRRRAHK